MNVNNGAVGFCFFGCESVFGFVGWSLCIGNCGWVVCGVRRLKLVGMNMLQSTV